MLRACAEFELAKAEAAAGAFSNVAALLAETQTDLASEESAALDVVGRVCTSLEQVCRWIAAKQAGVGDADRFLEAARTGAAIAQETLLNVRYVGLQNSAKKVLRSLVEIQAVTDVTAIVKEAALMPIPPFLIATRDPFGHGRRKTLEENDEAVISPIEGPVAIRVMLTLDGKPWANPQVVHSKSVYDVGLTVTVPHWPAGTDRLQLDFVSTLPADIYRITSFTLDRPADASGMETKNKGHLEFQSSQSLFSEPAVLQLRAIFLNSKDSKLTKTATVIGYHKLRARVSNPKETPLLSKYRALDSRIIEIVDEVRSLPGISEAHLSEFVAALAAVANYMGICAQQAIYQAGEKVAEQDFQKNILLHLRGQLGEEVIEAPKQAAGITDVQYRSVTIELKVEDKISDRKKMLTSYENQPTQYLSGVGSQLGILCVLDVTEKDMPPAPTQNNLIVLKPTLHGFPDGNAPAPSRVVAVVIDGNLRSPSSYSR